MTDIADLIARLEAATEGSHELDGRVYCGVNGLVFRSVSSRGFHFEPDAHGTHTHVTPTPFTRSIDAALTLVPEGWYWSINTSATADAAAASCFFASVRGRAAKGRDPEGFCRHGATPALALCVAALKARSAS
jgi:hypothetical protein